MIIKEYYMEFCAFVKLGIKFAGSFQENMGHLLGRKYLFWD